MKVVTAAEMREIDKVSIEKYSIPGTVLMNNAGKAIADFVFNNLDCTKADIFCGTGNNGGDGFTTAWYLKNYGADPLIYIAGSRDNVTPSSLVFLVICEHLGIHIRYIDDNNIDSITIRDDSVIIDSLIGTGFKGVLRGMPLKAAILINRSKSPVVSVDVPSGLSSDGEVPEGEVVKADYTITMGLPKISLVTYPGKEYCGELIIADIGFPPSLTDNEDIKIELLDVEYMKATDISAESDDIHKTDKGNTLIVGGLAGMEGAAILTAAAMFKTGTGLVTIATTETSRQIIAGKVPELMTTSLPEKPDKESVADLLKTKKYTALIIGPGLGRDAYAESVFSFVIDSVAECGIRKIIIDGDGLYHLVSYIKEKKLAAGISWIITPHFMEASRISGVSIEKLKNNRFQSCKMISEDTGCITVLKGPASIVSDGEKTYVNSSGNRALSTAGTGDVLSGVIGAFMNRMPDSLSAVCAAVYIHGLCADIYVEVNNIDSMSSSDILDYIRPALNRLT